MNTTWDVGGVREPSISASRLLERGRKLVLVEKPRIQRKNGDIIALERCGSLFAVRCGSPTFFLGKAEREARRRRLARPRDEGRMRNTHAV